MSICIQTSYTKALSLAIGIFASAILFSASAKADNIGKLAMNVVGLAKAPIGHVQFCQRQPSECLLTQRPVAHVVLTSARLEELDRVNRAINAQIEPVTDEELYGVAEYWTYPTDRGDCEDYVLLKRRTLIEAGWPASALLITVVRDLKGDGHAVLTVVTDRGDFVLDNQLEGILPWHMTGYEFVKRQSQNHPKNWVYVGPAQAEIGVASTRR